MAKPAPAIIGIGGFASNTGKTTLMCELLRLFPGWEAIKTTRGHYRSCGKDPHSCCVSHLLGDQSLIRSGRSETYTIEKDTGRYWEAGAANVHWVIATEDQVGQGIREALTLVNSEGVFIEGNSFSEFVDVDLMIMVARAPGAQIKKSARPALGKSRAFYLTGESSFEAKPEEREQFKKWLKSSTVTSDFATLPVYTWPDIPRLATEVQRVADTRIAESFEAAIDNWINLPIMPFRS
jgi:molybdopterin-guanine dinucleotide biosynthesis protein